VILSSHILPEVQSVCSRVMIIARGALVYNQPVSSETHYDAVLLRVRRPADAGILSSIPGVVAVEDLDEGRYRLKIGIEADPREAIADAAVKNGWGLIELRAQTKSLEEIFVELTSGEDARPDIKAAA
jgi:ABC-2 type transport system ATP-binding protein